MSSVLRRIATFSARHRTLVLGVWPALFSGIGIAGGMACVLLSAASPVPTPEPEAAR